METQLFHIFRNTPLGRETLLQSLYFCRMMNTSLVIYVPESTKLLMYFEHDVVQVDLDGSYIAAPGTALRHAAELAESVGLTPTFFKPKAYTASTLPDIPTGFDFMCSPRSISDLSSKIGLGYIGPKVRRIVQAAHFPVLIPSPVYKEWKRIVVFFGGSVNAVKALKLGFGICERTGMPMDIFTQLGKMSQKQLDRIINDETVRKNMDRYVDKRMIFKKGKFEDNLYEVPHDALAVMGAYGHGVIKEILFGSKMEKIQSTICNNFLIVGPNYKGVF